MLKLFRNAEGYGERLAIVHNNETYTYKNLVVASNNLALSLLSEKDDLKEERIGFLIPLILLILLMTVYQKLLV